MQRCFELASLGAKKVRPNPHVGAVLVYNNRIIGEGWHKEFGGAHAEVNCLNSVKTEDRQLIDQSTLYVSLEPCTFHGKTPACSLLIVEKKIPRVVISTTDPHPKVNGSGIETLRKNGIEVIESIQSKIGKDLIRDFRINMLEKRPYIILKTVKSKDHFIGKTGEKIWLSNPYSTILSHKWRSEVEGIMVGTETVLNDNPALNTRLYPGESPVRIVTDRQNRIPDNANVFNGLAQTILFSDSSSHDKNVSIERIPVDFKSDDCLIQMMNHLFELGIYTLLVEGGAKLIQSFLNENLWDEARIIQTDHLLKEGIKAPNITGVLKYKESIQNDSYYRIFRES